MNIQTALLPHKHVRFCDSIIALAGLMRKLLVQPMTVDELWVELNQKGLDWPGKPSFKYLLFALDVLFALGQIELGANGRVRRNAQ